jgi:hypothetical protein
MSQAETPNLLSTTTRQAVSEALSEFEVLGRTAFLARHGFGPARECFVKHPITDRLCDARAVVGAAYGYQFSMAGPLTDNTLAGSDAAVAALLKRLGFEVVSGAPSASKPPEAGGREWSTLEAELLVADYLQMLTLELNGQTFNKAARRRALLPLLNGRTEASIEFKRRNVSAIMGRLGFPVCAATCQRKTHKTNWCGSFWNRWKRCPCSALQPKRRCLGLRCPQSR